MSKIRLTLRRKADGVWLELFGPGGESGGIHCSHSGLYRIVNDLIDAAIAAGEFIPNPEEGEL